MEQKEENSFLKLQQMIQATMQDMHAGGELSLMNQIAEMKKELNKTVRQKYQEQVQQIMDLQKDMQETQKDIQDVVPPSKVSIVSDLQANLQKLDQQIQVLSDKKHKLEDDVKELRKNRQLVSQKNQSESQQQEYLVQLFHALTGVFWEDDDQGFVLSEEIAKPIKFSTTIEGTEQLWELIDM